MARSPAPAAQSPQTSQRLLAAAEEEFAEHGFAGTSTAAIARRAGVTKALVHYYFGSKESLHREVMERYEHLIAAPLLDELELEDPLAAVCAAARRYCAFLAEHPRYVRLNIYNALEGSRTLADSPLFQKLVETLTASLQRGMDEGIIRTDDPRQLLISIDSLCSYFFEHEREFQELWEEEPVTREQLIAARIEHAVHLIELALRKGWRP